MLPEIWQSVDRLLVLYFTADSETGTALDSALKPALQELRQALPEADITLLAVKENCEWVTSSFESGNLAAVSLQAQPCTSLKPQFASDNPLLPLIQKIRDRAFDAAIIFTTPSQSPYLLAYLCYLAGIPIRLGQSREFGGGVLSPCIKPPLETATPKNNFLYLLKSAGFSVVEPTFSELADQNCDRLKHGCTLPVAPAFTTPI